MKKQIVFTALVALLAFTSSTISAQESDLGALREKALKRIGVLPAQMPGAENDTKLKQQLGEKLYFDVRLSNDSFNGFGFFSFDKIEFLAVLSSIFSFVCNLVISSTKD